MDKAEKTLRNAGYEPDKPVSCLTVKQLYLLIRFAVGKTINHEEAVIDKTVNKIRDAIKEYFSDYDAGINIEKQCAISDFCEEVDNLLRKIKI